MKAYFIILISLLTIFSCGSSNQNQRIIKKSIVHPVKSAEAKGMIILYQKGNNNIFSYKIKKDKKKAILTLKTQFGFKAATVYMKNDSIWVVIPFEKVVYFQEKSNILLIPTIKTNNIPIGMLMDYLVGNFSFKYSTIYNDSDFDLIKSLREIKYGYINGDLAGVEYQYGQTVMNTSIRHIGNKVKLNLKKNNNLLMSIKIDNIILQDDMPDSIFSPKIPKNYQLINL